MPKGRFQATDDFDLSGHHLVDWNFLSDIPSGGAVKGEVLSWNGSTWNPKSLSTSDSDSPIAVYWEDIFNVPLVFPPDAHTHPLSEITDWPADHGDLTGLSDPDHPLSALQQDGAASSEAIVWGGTGWNPAAIVNSISAGTGISVSASTGPLLTISNAMIGGTGIDITGDTISHDLIAGTGIDITVATISHALIAGTGIDITGATISHALVAGTSIDITGATISVNSALTDQIKRFAAEIVVNGGSSVVTTGVKGYIEIPKNCTLVRACSVNDASGTVTWTIKKSSYSGFPGSLADITGGTNFGVSSAQKNEDTTLTGWTTDVNSGDFIELAITGTPATITIATLSLTFEGDTV